jgi:hypothetical protein
MKNAFESTLSQVKENKSKNVDSVISQQPDIEDKDNIMSTKQQVAKLSRQHSNKSTIKMSHESLNVAELERKTFYLKPELAEIFKYAKFKWQT